MLSQAALQFSKRRSQRGTNRGARGVDKIDRNYFAFDQIAVKVADMAILVSHIDVGNAVPAPVRFRSSPRPCALAIRGRLLAGCRADEACQEQSNTSDIQTGSDEVTSHGRNPP